MAIQTSLEGREADFEQFNQPQFDPVQFLNEAIPPLNLSSQGSVAKQTRATLLQSTSTEVQTLISKLNTHSIKSSTELTSATDEILRSGNRLAYEVEVLRGDVNNVYDLLTESLKDDIFRFVIDEVKEEHGIVGKRMSTNGKPDAQGGSSVAANEPEFIRQLRTLGSVKSRLEAVIYAFGEALKWPIPRSEVSMASTLISVSAPELGIADSPEDDKAREYTRKLRNDLIEVLDSGGGGAGGLAAATKKVNDLRSLSQIWKGTAEEKARTRIVDNLEKLVEERKKMLDARAAPPRSAMDGPGPRSSSMPGRAGRIVEGSTNTAAGIFRNLQKLRDEIYQD